MSLPLLTHLDGDERVLRVTFEDGEAGSGWVAIAVFDDGALPVLLEAFMSDGADEDAARAKLAALPPATCGTGEVEGVLDYCRGYIALDPRTGSGIVEVFGYELGQAVRLRQISGVESPKQELLDLMIEAQQEAAELMGSDPPHEGAYTVNARDRLESTA